MYIISIKDLISNKWRQVITPLMESSIIMNPNNIYMICIKEMMPSYNPVISKVLCTTAFKK